MGLKRVPIKVSCMPSNINNCTYMAYEQLFTLNFDAAFLLHDIKKVHMSKVET